MNYTEFKKKVIGLPLIFSRDMPAFNENEQAMRNQFRRWQARGLIIKLRKGVYILNEGDRKNNPSRQFIANQLYAPSYVSMEYALNFYGLIPERITSITSVSTRKTSRFSNILGVFTYRHVAPGAFRGFGALKDEAGLPFLIASPEKAVVDFLYLGLRGVKAVSPDMFRASYRFQNTEKLSPAKISLMAGFFKSKRLTGTASLFCEFLREERGR